MPRIDSINFYQNRPKIKLFLPKKEKYFERLGIHPPHPMPQVAGGFALGPQLPLVVGGSAPRPPQRPLPPLQIFGYGQRWAVTSY